LSRGYRFIGQLALGFGKEHRLLQIALGKLLTAFFGLLAKA
jgi:hypothetical protein